MKITCDLHVVDVVHFARMSWWTTIAIDFSELPLRHLSLSWMMVTIMPVSRKLMKCNHDCLYIWELLILSSVQISSAVLIHLLRFQLSFWLCQIHQTYIMATNDEQMLASFQHLDTKFRRACHHIRVLNRQIEDVQIRYDRAFSSGRRSFRYAHRLKLATFEGMRNMFYEYACRRADELEEMQNALIQKGLVADSDDEDSDENMEY